MNYTELKASIEYYTENTETDFVAEIPTFVKQAEDRIFHIVDHLPNFRKNATANTTASSPYLSTPTDFIFPYALQLTDGSSEQQFLLFKDLTFINQSFPDKTVEALPRFYAQWDDNTFMLAPTPDSAYTAQLDYTYKPETIVTASTTWIGDNMPSVLLYGSLIEAYTFMKGEDDLLALYTRRYDQALSNLKLLADGHARKDAYRDGQPALLQT